jgi:uncharacterized protein VirK/YbjX
VPSASVIEKEEKFQKLRSSGEYWRLVAGGFQPPDHSGAASRFPNYFPLQAKLRAIAPIVFCAGGLAGAWMRFKFLVRGLVYGVWMERWLEFLEIPEMRAVARIYPRLYLKVQWPYLNSSYEPARRLEMVQSHYRFVLTRFSGPLRSRLLIPHAFLCLGKWDLPELGTFSLRLSHENPLSQEGEMLLGLHHDDTDCLYAFFCFSITGESEISVGCLQGAKPSPGESSNKDLMIAFTRHLYGSRPKNLLLFALRQLAAFWSIDRIRAVSTKRHIWAKDLQTDYDTFWLEVGGSPEPDGMYDVPTSADFRDLREIKSKKRSMYRRRYRFLEILGREINGVLAKPDRPPALIHVSSSAPAEGSNIPPPSS